MKPFSWTPSWFWGRLSPRVSYDSSLGYTNRLEFTGTFLLPNRIGEMPSDRCYAVQIEWIIISRIYRLGLWFYLKPRKAA